MRTLLRLLGTRYGLSLVMVVLVLVVVAAFRGIVGQRQDANSGPALPTLSASPRESVPDDGLAVPSNGGTPTLTAAVAAEVKARATSFATAWLRHSGVDATQWHKGLAPHGTSTLLARLKNVDPKSVPAERVAGEMRLNAVNQALVEASVPLDSGALELTLVLVNNQWKVDAVGWEPAR